MESAPSYNSILYVNSVLSQSTILIVIIICLLTISAFVSAAEASLNSLNVIKIRQIARGSNKSKSKKAKKAYQLYKDYPKTLSTIVVLNNVVNMISSSLATLLFISVFALGDNGALMGTLIITIAVIVFGEILPKNIANNSSEKTFMFLTPFVYYSSLFLTPITYFLKKFNNLVTNGEDDEKVTATEDELIEIIQTIEHEGVLEQSERELIESAITFDDTRIKTVMTPKEEVTLVYEDATFEELKKISYEYKYSRIPVLERGSEKVKGVVYRTDIYDCLYTNKNPLMKELIKKPLVVSQSTKLPIVLEYMQRAKAHIAIVQSKMKDGEFVGIATLEDLLEMLVGEIYDEYDELPTDIVEIGHHIFEVEGSCLIENFFNEHADEVKLPPKWCLTMADLVDYCIKKHNRLNRTKKNFKPLKNKEGLKVKYENLVIRITKIQETEIESMEVNIASPKDLSFD